MFAMVARAMSGAFAEADPGNGAVYRRNLGRFLGEIDELDVRLKKILAGGPKKFMVFHPSWGYFAEAYGLEQVAIEVEGREPGPADIVRIIETARAEGIGTIFVQPQFSSRSARMIAGATGAQVVEADPLAENWGENLMTIARNIAGSGERKRP